MSAAQQLQTGPRQIHTIGRRTGRWIGMLMLLLLIACGGGQPSTEEVEATAVPLAADATSVAGPAAGGALTEDSDLVREKEETQEQPTAIAAATATPESTVPLPTIDPLGINGDITVGGSASVYPITRRMYRRFVREGYAGLMKIERVGSDEGFRLLCSVGTADIANVGRLATAAEIELCSSINRVPVPFAIGRGAVSLFVHPDNDVLTTTTLVQMSAILTATNWSDVDPAWPAEPIERFFPHSDSDEFAAVAKVVMDGNRSALLNAPNTTFFHTDDELIQTFTESPFAVGFVNHSTIVRRGEEFLQPVAIDGILPDSSTIQQGQYPLVYPLYLYTDAQILRGKPQVAAFLNFYLNHVDEEIENVGYYPTTVAAMDAARTQLLELTRLEE